MNSINIGRLSLVTAILFFLPVFLISGCKDLSNDPPQNGVNLVVNLGDIQRQLGVASNSTQQNGNSLSVSVPGDSEATDEVKSLLVGAFVVTTRNTPYTKDVAITEDIEENLKDELAGSVDYIRMISLPTDKDYIEFPYPKSELSRWQVIAVALDFEISEFAELGEDKHSDSILYFGFSPEFYTAGTIDENETVTIEMIRACLSNETVSGCATYSDGIDDEPVITPAVEILGVRYNETTSDVASTVSFPLFVRDSDDATSAVSELEQVRSEIISAVGSGNITSLTVRSTHAKNPEESAACRSFANDSSVTVTDLEENCEVQLNRITLAQ